MKAFSLAVTLVAVIASASARDNYDNIGYYNCQGKDNGNYLHPSDCTRFISCTEGRAADMACPDCHVDATSCPSGYLVYDLAKDACLWAHETTCGTDNGTVTTEFVTGETTEPEFGPTTTTDYETTEDTTTEEPATTPVPGEYCDPLWCKNNGTCTSFNTCNKNTSRVEAHPCPGDQFWEPLEVGCKAERIDGGECVDRKDLCPETLENYMKDKKCLACIWEATGECAAAYNYRPPLAAHPRDIITLNCRPGNVFDGELELCRPCNLVKRENGNSCC